MPAKPQAQPSGQAAGKGKLQAPAKPSAKPASTKPTPTKLTSGKPPPTKPCPICGKPATEAAEPFCSARCRDVDLNRWLSGSYVVPGKPEDDEDAE
jgi:uncharacterized protein